MRMRHKAWARPLLEEHPELNSFTIKDFDFNKNVEYILEIGGGKGEFIFENAQSLPNEHFIVYEKDVSCAGFILKKLLSNDIQNVHIINNLIEKDIEEWPKIKVKKIYLNFSDPWPKKRHAIKRLTHPEKFKYYYSILNKGGELRFKTDNDGFYQYTLESIPQDKFEIIANEIDRNVDGEIKTEFEKKFIAQGVKIKHVLLRKK